MPEKKEKDAVEDYSIERTKDSVTVNKDDQLAYNQWAKKRTREHPNPNLLDVDTWTKINRR